MSAHISRDEWLQALVEAGCHEDEHDPDAITVGEFAALMDMPRQRAERRLQRLEATGRARRTYKVGQTQSGRTVRFVAYRLVPADARQP